MLGCDSPEIKAKKQGFDSVELMQNYGKRGYESMDEYRAAIDFTTEKFYAACYLQSEQIYNKNCKNKKVSWKGIIERSNDNSIRIQVLSNNNMYPKNVFSVDTNTKIPYSLLPEIGKIVYFDGQIGDKNYVTPDIENFKPFDVINDEFVEERKKALRNDLHEDFLKKKGNYRWLKDNFSPKIDLICGNAVELSAKNSYRWTNGFLESKFPNLVAHKSKERFISAYGDSIQFQNGFGAWQKMFYECTYDTADDSVFSIKVN